MQQLRVRPLTQLRTSHLTLRSNLKPQILAVKRTRNRFKRACELCVQTAHPHQPPAERLL